MPIQPVSGEIQAQPLNNNFSFLDSKLNQVNGGPRETFTNEAALITKYPNGSNSAMLVTDAAGANGYLYTWNGTAWVKGPLYQAQGITNGSISSNKLSTESVTEEKTVFFSTGKNLFDKDSLDIKKNKGYSATTSTITDDNNYSISAKMVGNSSKKILISVNGAEAPSTFKVISFNYGNWLSTVNYIAGGVFLNQDANEFEIQYLNTASNIQVEFDSITVYEPFKIAFRDRYTKNIDVTEKMLKDKAVTPAKTSFFVASKNLLNLDDPEIQHNKGYSGESNLIVDSSEYNLSGKIYAVAGSSVFITVDNQIPISQGFKIIEFDSSGNWLRTRNVFEGIHQLSSSQGYFLVQYRPNLTKIMVSLDIKEEYEPFILARMDPAFVFVDSENQIADGVITEEKLAFQIDGGTEKKSVDLIIFAGQSNMAGRGVAAQAPLVPENHGYEFRAVSDPTMLHPIEEPFGVNENKIGGINEGTKTGSLVSSLINQYYALTKRKIVGISASQGGTRVDQWQPEGTLLQDAIQRLQTAVSWLESNDYTIKNKWLVWCQGESDGDISTTKESYQERLTKIIQSFEAVGINHSFLIRIGNHRDNATKYDQIIQAQTEYCKTTKNVTLIATVFDRMASEGLMKDEFHYTQEGYNLCGEQAGKNLAFFVNNEKEPTIFDWENQNLYFSHKAD